MRRILKCQKQLTEKITARDGKVMKFNKIKEPKERRRERESMMNQHVISVFTLPCEDKYLSSINLIVARMHVHVHLINSTFHVKIFATLPFLGRCLMVVDENESKMLRFSINITQTCRRRLALW